MSSPSSEYFSSIESELQRSLRPVQPNPEFVTKLHSRLVTPASTILERRPSQSLATPAMLLVGFGLAVGLFVVWAIRQLR
jgi:hypothetical protein